MNTLLLDMQKLDQFLLAKSPTQHEQAQNSADRWSYEQALKFVTEFKDHVINQIPGRIGNFHPNDCVLDIGCGGGAALRATASIITVGYLIGIDASPGMIQIAQEHSLDHPAQERMRFAIGTAENLPLSDNSVTGAWATDSIRHWPNERKGLLEARRVIAPMGSFLMIEDLYDQDYHSRAKTISELMQEVGFIDIRCDLLRADNIRLITVTSLNNKSS